MNEISVKAPAKLNLHLQVIAKRNDGFHDLRTRDTGRNYIIQFHLELDPKMTLL